MLAQLTWQRNFSPDWNSKLRRKHNSESGKTYRHYPLRWQHLPRMSPMKNNFSSHKRTRWLSQKNRPLRGKNNTSKLKKMGSNWGTILIENQCRRINKNRRKHQVVLHEWNQIKRTSTSRTGCRSSIQEPETGNTSPNLWLNAADNRRRYKHYKANEDRIIRRNGPLFRRNYGKSGGVKHY